MTIPPALAEAEPAKAGLAAVTPVAGVTDTAAAAGGPGITPAHTGSLSRRMMLIAAGWITILLLLGGLALDRTMTGLVTRNFDEQLTYILTAMVGSAEIGPDG